MQTALQHTYSSLLALQAQEDSEGSVVVAIPETQSEPVDWRKSITKHTVTCLECGQSFKQLSVRHLRDHRLADDKTLGESTDVSEGAHEGGTGCSAENEAGAEERDIENDSISRDAQEGREGRLDTSWYPPISIALSLRAHLWHAKPYQRREAHSTEAQP